jgi:flagellar biosynthesis anti-sigma factor FlgM
MRLALEAAAAAPDVRADKVADVRWRIARGTYTIDAEAVARRMLGVPA